MVLNRETRVNSIIFQKAEAAFYKDKSMSKYYTGERIKSGKEDFFSPCKKVMSILPSLHPHLLLFKQVRREIGFHNLLV